MGVRSIRLLNQAAPAVAVAADTISIAVMELVDNLIVLVVPGAMDAGLSTVLFWGSLALALAIAGAVAFPVNRYLIARGKGHAVAHSQEPPVVSNSLRLRRFRSRREV